MKPGDKVWYLDTARQKIASSIVLDIIHGECTGIETSANFFLLGHDCFPTREELCEHYRKIFGGIDRKALLDGINALKKDAKERHEDDCYLHGLYDVMDMINEELG